MNRLVIIAAVSIALAFSGLFLFALRSNHPHSATNEPRLVVLYATCSVNKDYLAPYNAAVTYTPNLKAFAGESIVFAKHRTESPFSGAAYASLFSGLPIYEHGVYYHPSILSDTAYLIAEAFRDNGYQTFFWNVHQHASDKLNYAQGVRPQNIIHEAPGDGHTLNLKDRRFSSILNHLNENDRYRAYVQINFSLTHAPYTARVNLGFVKSFCRSFPQECGDVTDQDLTQYWSLYDVHHRNLQYRFEETVVKLGLGPEQVMKLTKVVEIIYKSCIYQLDKTFGETILAIRKSGLLDQTLFVFTSDHGEILYRKNSRTKFFHSCLEPEVLNIPLLIRLPNGKAGGKVYSEITRAIDVFPTVASIAALKIPSIHHLAGTNLASAMIGTVKPPQLIAYSAGEMSHPAVGKHENVQKITVLAQENDALYTYSPSTQIEVRSNDKDGRPQIRSLDLQNPEDLRMQKLLSAYRTRFISGFKPTATDEAQWSEIREKLKSLGYLQ